MDRLPGTRRSAEIDIFRGIAVIGVVFSHTVDGLLSAGALPEGSALHQFNDWFYGFRMPAIALVLGLFLSYGAEKYGTATYIARRAVFAVYMYLLWYVIQMGAELATSPWKNTPVTLEDALRIWAPPAHLWFIPYIAVSAAVIALVAPWRRAPWLTLPLLLAASTATWGWGPDLWGMRGLALVGFSAVGAVIGMRRMSTVLTTRAVPVVLVGAAALLLAIPFFGMDLVAASVPASPEQLAAGRASWLPPSVALSWLGQFILAGLAVALGAIPRVREAFALVGRSTLQIYLAHIIVIAGLRIVLMRLGVDSLAVLVPTLLVAGVVIPLLAERILRPTPLRYVFEMPAAWLPGAAATARRLSEPVHRPRSG
ncbi:acyltransferase family protein [Brachybacterium saurashtrense]|uniref:Acyltransferase n=1 Tax=Brachybacterium saurashtrense TaxID=556288 RepID=A0A345YSH8_9MICO|nr:acyltransferase [Brachybacterium saurashtrense]AXK46880.1 acyltransferase [Brachybacterium saurashtrense]RRR22595.1 acyltransferase [Brachybacterium saurashtrense]